MSLRAKIVIWFISIQIITVFIISSISITYLYHAGIQRVTIHAQDALNLISAAVAESLFVVNLNSAKEIIDSAFNEIESISFLQIRGENNEVLGEKRKGIDLTYSSIQLKRTIELGGITFGTLRLHFSTKTVQDLIWDQTLLLWSIAAIIISISTIFVYLVANKTIDIIEEIRKGVVQIVDDKIPAIIDKPTNLTDLVIAYNSLVDKCTMSKQ